MRPKFFFWLIVVLAIAALIQIYFPFYFFGARLNLVLAVLISLAFLIDQGFLYFILVLCASFFTRYAPGWSKEILALCAIALVAFWLRVRIVAPSSLASGIFAALGTFIFYLLINPVFVYDKFTLVSIEAVGNIIISLVTFTALRFAHENSRRSTI